MDFLNMLLKTGLDVSEAIQFFNMEERFIGIIEKIGKGIVSENSGFNLMSDLEADILTWNLTPLGSNLPFLDIGLFARIMKITIVKFLKFWDTPGEGDIALGGIYGEGIFHGQRIFEDSLDRYRRIGSNEFRDKSVLEIIRDTTDLYKGAFEGVYKIRYDFIRNLAKGMGLKSGEAHDIAEDILSIYVTGKPKEHSDSATGKLQSDYRCVRNAIGHVTYRDEGDVIHFDVTDGKGTVIMDPIEMNWKEFTKWPFYIEMKSCVIDLVFTILNLLIALERLRGYQSEDIAARVLKVEYDRALHLKSNFY